MAVTFSYYTLCTSYGGTWAKDATRDIRIGKFGGSTNYATIFKIHTDSPLTSLQIGMTSGNSGDVQTAYTYNWAIRSTDAEIMALLKKQAIAPGYSSDRDGTLSLKYWYGYEWNWNTISKPGGMSGDFYLLIWSTHNSGYWYSGLTTEGISSRNPAYAASRVISYSANGHGTAPASQTGYDAYTLTLRSVISPVSETNTEDGASEDVVFSANGGGATPAALSTTPSITYSDKFTQPNWLLGSTTYAGGASYKVTGAVTFLANWNRTQHDETSRVYSTVTLPAAIDRADEKFAEYTVTLDARNGSATTQKLSDRMRKWAFGGWNTNESGTGDNYPAGGSYTNGGATLYAKWENNGEYALPITLPEPKRSGYKFMGWAESTSAKEGVMDEYTPSANVVLYAIWKVVDPARVYKDGKWRMVLPYVFKDGKWHLTQSTIKR